MDLQLTVDQRKQLERQAAKKILGFVAIKLFTGFFFVDLSRRIDKRMAKR